MKTGEASYLIYIQPLPKTVLKQKMEGRSQKRYYMACYGMSYF